MNFGSTLGMLVIGAMTTTLAAGCTAPTDDPAANGGSDGTTEMTEMRRSFTPSVNHVFKIHCHRSGSTSTSTK